MQFVHVMCAFFNIIIILVINYSLYNIININYLCNNTNVIQGKLIMNLKVIITLHATIKGELIKLKSEYHALKLSFSCTVCIDVYDSAATCLLCFKVSSLQRIVPYLVGHLQTSAGQIQYIHKQRLISFRIDCEIIHH